MVKKETTLGDFHNAGDDAVVPFAVETLDARGRAVQLGASVTSILERHDYPEPVSKLLAEVMVLTVLLGTSLKYEGKFIVQTSSQGPVNLLVCDFQTPSNLRAYARFDEDALNKAIEKGQTSPEELLGKGTLALTVDQGEHMQRYQGIVALDGSNLQKIARNYFAQSEQIPTNIRLAVACLFERDENGKQKKSWRAGGLLAQFFPRSSQDKEGDEGKNEETDANNWLEIQALTNTVESIELTDPEISVERLLYRLFHEAGVKVFEATKIKDQCSCSRDKIKGVLQGLTAEEIDDSIQDGEITVVCEFCSTSYHFTPKEIKDKQLKANA